METRLVYLRNTGKVNHEFTIHNSRCNTCKQQFTFPTQVTQPTTTNTGIPAGIFPAENGNRENGRENTPTVPVPVPACFPVLFSYFFRENGLRLI